MKWVYKSSSVIVGTQEGDQVFHSLDECPLEIKNRLREVVNGPNSQTLLITNREALEALRESAKLKAARTRELNKLEKAFLMLADIPRWQLRIIAYLYPPTFLILILRWASS